MTVCRDECCQDSLKTYADAAASDASSQDVAETLAKLKSCCDMEALIESNDNFCGEIIAEPSTPRSILVSAPKHIIIPYQAPAEVSACEQRKKQPVEVVEMGRLDAGLAKAAEVFKSAPANVIGIDNIAPSSDSAADAKPSAPTPANGGNNP